MKTNRNAGYSLVEIMIILAIIGLLAAIAIPNFMRAKKQSDRLQALRQAPTFNVTLQGGSLIDLGNRFGSEGVAEDPVGYGDFKIKDRNIQGDDGILSSQVILLPYPEAIEFIQPQPGYTVARGRWANLRELLSLGVSDDKSIPRNREIYALGTFSSGGPHEFDGLVYPVIRGRTFEFANVNKYTNALFAVVRTK